MWTQHQFTGLIESKLVNLTKNVLLEGRGKFPFHFDLVRKLIMWVTPRKDLWKFKSTDAEPENKGHSY